MKKNVRKVIGISAMFIGVAAGYVLDSDMVFMIGVFGGGALLSQGESIEDIK